MLQVTLPVYLVAIFCMNYGLASNELNYKSIDEYLTKHVTTTDPIANMRAAIDWLNSGPEESIENALYDLTLMSRIPPESMCTKASHDVLSLNNEATGGRAHLEQDARSRVEEIVNYFCTRHAEYCRQVYPINFVKKYRLINRGYIREVETFINEHLIQTSFNMIDHPLVDNSELYDRSIINTELYARLAHESIKILAQADIVNDYKTLEHLFKRYIVVPCKYFVQELGPDVFLPSIFDATWNRRVESDDVEFYLGLARFRICNYLMENEVSLVQSMENSVGRV